MDQPNKKSRKDKKHPRVPIKTYRWEDVRRARKKGGYPWTYLYKQPFDEEPDPEPFTMEGLRKSKSASTLGKPEGVEISEIKEPYRGNFGAFLEPPQKVEFESLQIVAEPDDHSIKNSSDSVVIEEMSDGGSQKPENVVLESADSSDNISQYLDKEDRGPDKLQRLDSSQIPEENEGKMEENNSPTKPEEQKRKRKISAESSRSKLSLSKMAMIKKIKDAKNRIKVPKVSFPASKLKKQFPRKTKNSPPEVKKDIKSSSTQSNNHKPPVYIHIPLKPPSGQTDEFSYLEFEEKSPNKPQPAAKLGSFRDVVKSLKQKLDTKDIKEDPKRSSAITPVEENEGEENLAEREEMDVTEPPIELNIEDKLEPNIPTEKDNSMPIAGGEEEKQPDKNSSLNQDSTNLSGKELETDSVKVEESTVTQPESKESGTLHSNDEHMEGDNKYSVEEEEIIDTTLMYDDDEDKAGNEIFDKLFEASESSRIKEDAQKPKQVRSKSAEPERRRKLSLESSYSRKSLSKLGILKKLKETGDKIKNTLSRSSSKKQTKKKEEETPIKKEPKTPKKLKPEKPVEPVYIHIPLKPPEGQNDEFSYLEFEGKKPPPMERRESTPDSPLQSDGVQFIILTAPSDDEILDYHSSDVPDTPSSETKLFFTYKVNELKELAKDIVDELNISKQKKLDTVTEETNGDKTRGEETAFDTQKQEKLEGDPEANKAGEIKNEETKSTVEEAVAEDSQTEGGKMMIDEEDGLNETMPKQGMLLDPPVDKQVTVAERLEEPKVKSNLKDESSPVVKKKVSFKRRSRTPKDGIYEDIHILKPTDGDKAEAEKAKTPVLEAVQSMSVDEEKNYLDDKIIKSTSLEEDYNKWSKISDHEYEPVNPPPDNETFLPPSPTVHIIDIDQEPKYVQPITELDITNTEVPRNDEIINKTEPRDNSMPSVTLSPPADGVQTQDENSSTNQKGRDGPNKFQLAFKQKADQLKSKFHIRKPHITMPDKSKFKSFKIEKPKINFPKIPDTTKVILPSFKLPRKSSEKKRSLKERQLSTESNDGDSKKPIFAFSTYPRIFKKKPKPTVGQNAEEVPPDFATVPRAAGKTSSKTVQISDTDSVRIPLHSEQSMEAELDEDLTDISKPVDSYQPQEDDDVQPQREGSVEERIPSHIRYEEDIDIDDEYDRESQDINRDEYLRRWDFGNYNPDQNEEYLRNYKNSQYKVTDLDSPDDVPGQNDFNSNNNKENYSSGSSLGIHRVGGVLEEIDSDEFFLRQKGISQDNIEVGMLLSSEIREAFRMPDNALSKMQDAYLHEYGPAGSNQSLPESPTKRKPIKKPKRKKTPHASQEQIPYAEESGDEDMDTLNYPPSRPKRRSKRVRKPKNADDIIPYQETISLDTNNMDPRIMAHRESLGILGDDEREADVIFSYENEKIKEEQLDSRANDSPTDNDFNVANRNRYNFTIDEDRFEPPPAAPPRKPKSLRSLNVSENGSISADLNLNRDILDIESEIIREDSTIPEQEHPPQRPTRMKSHTSSQSVIISQPDEEILQRTESLTSENQIPCVEEPCIQDIRDYMGYAIIDKQKVRDPPLPPPRTAPRRKRSIRSNKSSTSETKFFTVPRPAKESEMPVRPLRNYSTLGHTRKPNEQATYENKENIDVKQYYETDDEPNRDLQSGDVIKKMKDRPLPAPPRPPRKSRPLRDITSKENIAELGMREEKSALEESEVSTQTEPLPDDFICEEVVQEPSDTILSPSTVNNSRKTEQNVVIERRLITPTYYTHEETITHGSLVVEALNGHKILPDSEITTVSKERIVPITTDSDGETSSIPEDFKKLRSPPQEDAKPFAPPAQLANPEMSIVKTLQVSDLDVDTLTVNKLLAGSIFVSEIDSNSVQTNEISSKSGVLKVGEIELPPGVIQKILETIKAKEEQVPKSEKVSKYLIDEATAEDDSLKSEQKKTPADLDITQQTNNSVETDQYNDNQTAFDEAQPPIHHTDSVDVTDESQKEAVQLPRPTRSESFEEETAGDGVASENIIERPQRPPRQSDFNSNDETRPEPDVDDEPPPRPPQPQFDCLPSQPPTSFYALRAQSYVETLGDNIPVVPRRKRHPKSKPVSRSSSEESAVAPVSRRHHSRTPEPSIPQLSGQLVRACGSVANNALKRLVAHLTSNLLENADGKQDLHVMMIIMLVLIAGLILLGYGDEKTVVHLHHWEYFNPPKDM